MTKKYIFGYGSLVSKEDIKRDLLRDPGEMHLARLDGWIRDWGISIHNATADRHYEFEGQKGQPEYVSILNIRKPSEGEKPTCPNGVLYEVTDQDISRMDNREKHYRRQDISVDIVGAPEGIVYAYVGLDKFRKTSNKSGGNIVPLSYLTLVTGAFQTLGVEQLKLFNETTLSPNVPVLPTTHHLTR